MKILCLAHDRDVDGIGSHAILRRYAAREGVPIDHHFLDYPDLCSTLSRLSGGKGWEVVIADLGYSPTLMECLRDLERLAERNRVSWFDHHDWTEGERLQHLPISFHLQRDRCACEIVQEEFLPGDDVGERIARLAHHHDFHEEDALAWRLYEIISSGYEKEALVDLLSKGIFWNRELEKRHRAYQEFKEAAFRTLQRTSACYRIGALTCVLGYSPPGLGSTLATAHLLGRGADLVVCLWRDGKMSFRRRREGIDLVRIARLFRGGGRADAAGGFLGREVDENTCFLAFREIAERIGLALQGEVERADYLERNGGF
jgi:oligoribonuclease NrnB/cAMP/cGMP phosphodiesterase (DHH superfamily)